ncbi:uncharacterized protein K452DRAFT_287885 [Aplosporella prunicola CBS 121167]|uniref:Uncharacterized protein n=1 Tax=Aplosporella prunicola CBS 121167 TaxID=1176127 RepID=A0A6A6BC50_9PEZI|nr:uncharacterized protein K452DRAFT_287885 [Aplosporella prunicola CBS 121167]KAF2141168.1 hypothetical protein K452DRAFT_287885 [Aplosporella prunicola CBS 121167]
MGGENWLRRLGWLVIWSYSGTAFFFFLGVGLGLVRGLIKGLVRVLRYSLARSSFPLPA